MTLLRPLVAIVVLDQVSKAVVIAEMAVGESVPVWSPWLHFTLVKNTGAAFGLLQQYPQLLTVVGCGVVGAALLYRRQLSAHPPKVQLALGVGLGGAVGNLLDRLLRGSVIDFVDLGFWPVFNLADVAIVLATVYIIWSGLRIGSPAGRTDSSGLTEPASNATGKANPEKE